jgi:hypothetical protein
MLRTVIIGIVVAIVGADVGCRRANLQAPAVPTAAPAANPATPEAATAYGTLPDALNAAAPAPATTSLAHEEGDALFVKPLGFLLTPRVAADNSGVVLAASGGCNDARGPLVWGAREPTPSMEAASKPGSFVVLAKLDNDGNRVWNKTFVAPCPAPPTDGVAHAVAGVGMDRNGNIYLAGDLRPESGPIDFGGGALVSVGGSDVFVVSFNAAGQHRWSKRFGDGANQHAAAMAVSPDGLVAIFGSLEGSVDFGGGVVKCAGKSDAFVAVLDSASQHVASHAFGDANSQYGDFVAFGSKGELTLAGTYEGAIDFGGGPLPAGGKTPGTFLAQYRDNGPGSSPRYAFAFNKALPADVTIGALASGSEGTYVAGQFKGVADFGGGPLRAHEPDDKNAGRNDAFIVKLDAAGKVVFSKAFGLGGTHRIEGLALAGDVWIAGEFSGMTRFGDTMVSAGGDDALLVHIDADKGDVKRAWRFGDTFSQRVVGLASAGSPGSLLLLAGNHGTIDFGAGPRSEHGGFLVKVAAGAPPVSKGGGGFATESPPGKTDAGGTGFGR